MIRKALWTMEIEMEILWWTRSPGGTQRISRLKATTSYQGRAGDYHEGFSISVHSHSVDKRRFVLIAVDGTVGAHGLLSPVTRFCPHTFLCSKARELFTPNKISILWDVLTTRE